MHSLVSNKRIFFAMTVTLMLAPPLAGQVQQKKQAEELDRFSAAIESLSLAVSPAVVQVFASGYTPASGFASSASELLSRSHSTGSGVLLTPDGYIVTNAHVIGEAQKVQVMLTSAVSDSMKRFSIMKPSGKKVGAQIVGRDEETDLAVLKIPGTALPFLRLGNSDLIRKGQIVLALGSPLGLQNSVSMGIVSSVARQQLPDDPMIYIQTDATINPGNSGGPLINTAGEVVGINTFILSQSGGSEGIGFAAPSNIVRNIYMQIRESGRVRRGEIGVHAQTITPTLAQGLGLRQNWGVILGDVYPGSTGDLAGLRIGDIVLSMDGKVMENGRQFNVNLYSRGVDSAVELELLREGQPKVVRVRVVERRDDPGRLSALVSPDRNILPRLGVLALDLNDEIRGMLPPLRKARGVVVAARAADAPYGDEGLLPGDVIYSVNREAIAGLSDLRDRMSAFRIGEGVVIQTERNGRLRFVTLEIE